MSAAHTDIAQVTAVILAGGLGTRLRPAVVDCPKVLAPVVGRPFITYLLDQLAEAGAQQVVLCTGYLGEQVEATLGRRYGTLRLSYSAEPVSLGTGGALRHAAPLLDSDPVLVMNGDSYCDVQLGVFLAWHRAHHGPGSLVLTRVQDVSRYGSVQLGPGSAIQRFVEKQDGASAGNAAGWISAGIYLLNRSLIQSIASGHPVSIERDVFPAWIPRGLYGYPRGGRFLDIGTPGSYAEAVEFFADLRDRPAHSGERPHAAQPQALRAARP